MKTHHDYRDKRWDVSLNGTEYEAVETLQKASGLSKAAYGRRALMDVCIVPRLEQKDREQLAQLNKMHANINEIAKNVNTINKINLQNRDEKVILYLMKVQHQLDYIEDSVAKLINLFSSKVY